MIASVFLAASLGAPQLTLASPDDAAGACAVVAPSDASASQAYAAEELADWIGRLTGVRPAVARGAVPRGAKRTIRLATAKPEEGLGTDGFRLLADADGVTVRGSAGRGCLYGAYELLERFGGIRWYSSAFTHVPKAGRLAVPAGMDVTERPAFEMRQPFWHDVATHPLFAARLKVNGFNHVREKPPERIGGDSFRFGGGLGSCHTFERLLPPERHYAAHPEYYAWNAAKGERHPANRTQPCLTNPEVLRLVTEEVLRRIRADPGAKYYGVSQNDWLNYCECPACRAVDDEEGSHAGTMVRFVNAVAEAVEREFPDVIIETLAYQYTRKPPRKTRVRRNVMPCLCTIECDFASPLATGTFAENASFREDIRGWAAQTDRLYVWDYVTDFSHYPGTWPNGGVLRENARFFRDNGVKALFEQGDYNGANGDYAELKAWLLAKYLWNPEADEKALLDDFFPGYYGAAAPFVRRHYETAIRRWRESKLPLGIYEKLSLRGLPDSFFAEAETWRERALAAAADDPEHADNVRAWAFTVDYTRVLRFETLEPRARTRAERSVRYRAARRAQAFLAGRPDVRLAEGPRDHGARLAVIERVVAPADPLIGTSGLGHVTPAATVPFGLVQAGPDTSKSPKRFSPDWAHTCGYQHGDTNLWRFSLTHLSGTGCPSLGDIGLISCVETFDPLAEPAVMYKDSERATPGHYAVTYREKHTRTEMEATASEHCAAFRFRIVGAKEPKLLLDLDWGIGSPGKGDCWGKYVKSCRCEFPTPLTARGGRRVFNWNDYEIHFAMAFSHPVVSRRKLREGDGVRGEIWELSFARSGDLPLEVRVGLSAVSEEQAAANLAAEMPRFDFDGCRRAAAEKWKAALGRIALDEGTDPETRANFSAALYRAMLQPNDLGDAGGEPFYSTLSLWDTFRAAHPLYTLVAPERVDGFVNSMLRQCDEQGFLPIWALGGGENHCMIGHHAVPVIADAYLKGFRGFDAERAWRAVKQSLTVNHRSAGDGTWGLVKEDWDLLDRYGYYPWDAMRGAYGGMKVRGESVARTLECAYDDACAARFAAALGKAEDAAFFARRSANWTNVFDRAVGFMRGRGKDGRWREPFDPLALGGGPWTDNDFCEGNSWQYTWHVMQDPEGLIAAFGGREKFVEKLTALFDHPPVKYANRPTSDVTGLIGQYAHGNEPSHHVIYFFTLAGRPDLAAKYVRKVFDTQYAARADGLCGNDDCGQMAAWYVFSALGFYPFDPCGGAYVVGAPQVPGATLALPGGRTLRIRAENFGAEGAFVRRVTLNGRELPDFKLRHADLLQGGELVFEMK